MLSPDTTIQNRYRLIYVVDERPGGQVCRARDEQSGQLVLVSILPAADAQAADELAQLAGQTGGVQHSALLPLSEHFADPLGYCLVSPDPGGQDLERTMRARGGPLPESEVLVQASRLLEALELLHRQSPPLWLGHLWPSDLWATRDGGWRMLPATLARPLPQQPSPYRAPELALPQAEPTAATDTYAVCALLYHLLTGWAPPSHEQQGVGMALTEPRTLNPQISELAEQALLRGLQPRAADRYQNARELRLALQTVQLVAERPLGLGSDTSTHGPGAEPQAGPLSSAPPPPQIGPPAYVGVTQVITPPAPPAEPGQVLAPPTPQRRGGLGTGCLLALVIGLLMLVATISVALVLLFLYFNAPSSQVGRGTLAGRPTAPPATAAPTAPPAPPRPPVALPAGAITPQNANLITRTREITSEIPNAALYSPDGRWLAIGISNAISLREPSTLQEARRMTTPGGIMIALAFSPDSRLLASGAVNDPVVRVWEVDSGRLVRELRGHTGWVRALAFSPDGRLLASGAVDSSIRLWDVASGEQLRTLDGHSDWVSMVAFSPDGASLASTSRDGTLRLWAVDSGQQREGFRFQAPLNPETNSVYWTTGLAFSPDGGQLAVGAADAVVYVLDAASGRPVRELRGHTSLILFRGVLFSPDGRQILTAGADRSIRAWNAADGAPAGVYRGHALGVYSISISPDGQQLVSTSHDEGIVQIWNTDDQSIASQLRLGQGLITNLAYSDDSAVLGLTGFNGMLQLYLIDSMQGQLFDGSASVPQPLAFVAGRRLAAITGDKALLLISPQRRTTRQLTGLDGPPLCVAASRDGTLIAAGTTRGQVGLWEADSGRMRASLSTTLDRINGIALNDDGSLLALAGSPRNPVIEVWDVDAGRVIQTIRGSVGMISALAFQPNGALLAATDGEGTLWMWEAATGAVAQEQSAREDGVALIGLGFSPDGALIATGSSTGANGQLIFWETTSGRQVAAVDIAQGGVLALAYSPDGRQVAVSIHDEANSVYIYGIP